MGAQGSATQLVANNLSFDYEGTPVLRDVSLSLSGGEVLGLVGDNGAGKSTLLWILSGRRKPTHGSVKHVGVRVLGSQELEAPYDSTVQMLIDEALGPSKRRLEALEEAAEGMAQARDEAEAAAAEKAYSEIFSDVMAHDDWNAEHHAEVVLDHLGLTGTAPDGAPLTDQLTTEISGGQRARLGLALTLIRKPEILLLDEPTNHLDERGRQLVINTIHEHAASLSSLRTTATSSTRSVRSSETLFRGVRVLACSAAITPPTTSTGVMSGHCGSTSGARRSMSATASKMPLKMVLARSRLAAR